MAAAVVTAVTMVVGIVQGLNNHLLSTYYVPAVNCVSAHGILIIHVTIPPLTAVFTEKVPNASCGRGVMLGAMLWAKMTTMWSLTQDA